MLKNTNFTTNFHYAFFLGGAIWKNLWKYSKILKALEMFSMNATGKILILASFPGSTWLFCDKSH